MIAVAAALCSSAVGWSGAPLVLALEGEADDDDFGASVEGAGDVDADGWPELLIGAGDWGETDRGKVYLFRGGPELNGIADLEIEGQRDHGGLGTRVAGLGDVDGDGFDDFAARDQVDSTPHPLEVLRVYFGASELSALASLVFAEDAPFSFGYGISVSSGDFDCDGYSDLVIGGFEYDRVVSNGTSTVSSKTGSPRENLL